MATTFPKTLNKPMRADMWRIFVHLDGQYTGTWDKRTGGELDSEETKYSPGGMGDPISLGGRVTPTNVVLQKIYDYDNDHNMIDVWYAAVGSKPVDIFSVPLDRNGAPYGMPIQHSGTLKRVHVPDVDSEASTAALFEIEVTIGPVPSRQPSPGG